ncbi:MAG TPA: CDP-alcohol phosphatidyltransferase family protein [Chthoniobacterales bacterium]|nr:CDP-alcohol phosphatidyltransferase family protein [Chthoniobacterales bacterium]
MTPRAAKSSEIAELADVYFFHPLGAKVAGLAAALRMSPTQVTVIGGLIGVAGGALLYDERLGLLAFAILILHGIIDSADGQLARLTGRTTELGKVLDGGAGYVTHAAIYLAIAAGMLDRGGSSVVILWMALAGIATAAHAQMYEYHRTAYCSIVEKGQVPRQEPSRVAPWLRGLYRGYLLMQRWLSGRHGEVEAALSRRAIAGAVTDEDRIRYRNHFYAPVRGWNFLGDNTRFYAIGALAWFHRIDLYFAFILLPMNLACVATWLWQRRADQRFLASL